MDENLKAVASEDPVSQLMENIVPGSTSLLVSADEFDDAGWPNPLVPLIYAAARKASAKDWFGGIALAKDVVGNKHEIQVHHIFPKAAFKKAGVASKDLDEIALLPLLPPRPHWKVSNRPPDQYPVEIADKHAAQFKTQCTPIARSPWDLDRFQDLLAPRQDPWAAEGR